MSNASAVSAMSSAYLNAAPIVAAAVAAYAAIVFNAAWNSLAARSLSRIALRVCASKAFVDFVASSNPALNWAESRPSTTPNRANKLI